MAAEQVFDYYIVYIPTPSGRAYGRASVFRTVEAAMDAKKWPKVAKNAKFCAGSCGAIRIAKLGQQSLQKHAKSWQKTIVF